MSEQYKNLQVHNCLVEVHLYSARTNVKFPCLYFVEWKSMNGKIIMGASKNQIEAVEGVVTFDEKLTAEVQLLVNKDDGSFIKKDSVLSLNLISKRRPDQQKLVGRITIDLAKLVTGEKYAEKCQYKLDYCSVNASLQFKASLISQKISQTPPENLDQDSFSDYQSFISGLHNNRQKPQIHDSKVEDKTIQKKEQVMRDSSWRTKKDEKNQQGQRGVIEKKNQESQSNYHKIIPKTSEINQSYHEEKNICKDSEQNRNQIRNIIKKPDNLQEIRQKDKQQKKQQISTHLDFQDKSRVNLKQEINKFSDLQRGDEGELKTKALMDRLNKKNHEITVLQKEKMIEKKKLIKELENVKVQKDEMEHEIMKLKQKLKAEQVILEEKNISFQERKIIQISLKQVEKELDQTKRKYQLQKKEKEGKIDELDAALMIIRTKENQIQQIIKRESQNRKSYENLHKQFIQGQKLLNNEIASLNRKLALKNEKNLELQKEVESIKASKSELVQMYEEAKTNELEIKAQYINKIDNLQQSLIAAEGKIIEAEQIRLQMKIIKIQNEELLQVNSKLEKELQRGNDLLKKLKKKQKEMESSREEYKKQIQYLKLTEKRLLIKCKSENQQWIIKTDIIEQQLKEERKKVLELEQNIRELKEKDKLIGSLNFTQELKQSTPFDFQFKIKLEEKERQIQSLQEVIEQNREYQNSLQEQIIKAYDEKMSRQNGENHDEISSKNEQIYTLKSRLTEKQAQLRVVFDQFDIIKTKMEEQLSSQQSQSLKYKLMAEKLQKEKLTKKSSIIDKKQQEKEQKMFFNLTKMQQENEKLQKQLIKIQNTPKFDDDDYYKLQQQLVERDEFINQLNMQLAQKEKIILQKQKLDEDMEENVQFKGVLRIIPAYSEGSKPSNQSDKVQFMKYENRLQYEPSRISEMQKPQEVDHILENKNLGNNSLPNSLSFPEVAERLKEKETEIWRLEHKNIQLENQLSDLREQNFENQLQKQTIQKRYSFEKQKILREIDTIDNVEVKNKLQSILKAESIRLDTEQSGSRYDRPPSVNQLKNSLQKQSEDSEQKTEEYFQRQLYYKEIKLQEKDLTIERYKVICEDFEKRINHFKEKEEMMKQNLLILEEQSNRIMNQIQERDRLIQNLKGELGKNSQLPRLLIEGKQQKQIETFRRELSAKDKLINHLKHNNSSLEVQLHQLTQEQKKLQSKLEDIEEQLFVYQSNENIKDIQIQQLKEKVQKLEEITIKNDGNMGKKYIEAENKIYEFRVSLKQLEQEKKQYKSKIKQMEESLQSLQQQFLQLQAKKEKQNEVTESNLMYIEELQKKVIEDHNSIIQMSSKAKDKKNNKDHEQNRKLNNKVLEEKCQELSNTILENEEQIKIKNEKIKEFQNILKQERIQYFKKKEQMAQKIEILELQSKQKQLPKNRSFEGRKIQGQIAVYKDHIQALNEEKVDLMTQVKILEEKVLNQSSNREKELLDQIQQLKEERQVIKEESRKQIGQAQKLYHFQREKMKAEFEEKQLEHMNAELNYQFKLKQKEKSDNLRRSFNASQQLSINDVVPAYKNLLQLLDQRREPSKTEQTLELLFSKLSNPQMFSSSMPQKQKSLILEKTRVLSMELSKMKASIMKSKIGYNDRTKLISNLRPFEGAIREILDVSEIFAESLMTAEEGSRDGV